MELNEIIQHVIEETSRAERMHPQWPTDLIHSCQIVQEESGELAKAALEAVYEPHKSSLDDVRKESIQTAAAAVRFLLNLDAQNLDTRY